MTDILTAFAGHELLTRAPITEAVRAAKERVDLNPEERIAIFDESGRAIDIDYRGNVDEVIARLSDHTLLGSRVAPPKKTAGPGRPKLGVVSREISLLPRHWEWLGTQSGGASGALRRLVDEARRKDDGAARTRATAEAAHRFMWDMAGDLPGFEEASRALWAGDHATLEQHAHGWPADVRDHLFRMLAV
jgi:hypothetical protein